MDRVYAVLREFRNNYLVGADSWAPGEFRGRYEHLRSYCEAKYRNFQIHKGLFDCNITTDFLSTLEANPPILVWIDCDYYSSAKIAMEGLMPHLRHPPLHTENAPNVVHLRSNDSPLP
jgi:hypothetical protein